jgi:hypothetical protein
MDLSWASLQPDSDPALAEWLEVGLVRPARGYATSPSVAPRSARPGFKITDNAIIR